MRNIDILTDLKEIKETIDGGLIASNITTSDGSNVEASITSLKSKDGDLTTLQTTNKTNLVSAINEVFQSANNGKTTIATAVGSPLTSGDTFSAMGSKIDTLTSTLKTNLSNKGVTVGTEDKMASLIDKVGGIEVKENINGVYLSDIQHSATTWTEYVIPINSDFIPSRVLVCISDCKIYGINVCTNGTIDSLYNYDTSNYVTFTNYSSSSYWSMYCYIGNIKKESFSIFLYNSGNTANKLINPLKYTLIK